MLEAYYSRRAPEYEAIYRRDDPVRRAEQAALARALCEAVSGKSVLEIACGTGYWTEAAARTARRIVAIDTSEAMLDIAGRKPVSAERVEFRRGDAYALESVPGVFDAVLASFWLSHVPRTRMDEFLGRLHRRLGSGGAVFLADNVYVPGIGGELVHKPGHRDTYKRRILADGSEHEILKNYYDADSLAGLFEDRAAGMRIHHGTCFWWVHYTVP
jgi:ubiquinone/menaquinone biosynthesis C-methylase UbiE